MDRRNFLSGATSLALAAGTARAAEPGPVVVTTAGRVRGATHEGIHSFKGIRYGAPTGGASRFLPPRPPARWNGVQDALAYGPDAPRRRPGSAPPVDPPWPELPESEDCLVLNVWTPGLADKARRPVMVWLHGGGFVAGSASAERESGVALCRRGNVVIVSPNHRLSVLGHTHLARHGGPRFASSGNAGMLDLVLALRWVRDNIAAFGGDPGNVTIFGQSGGGQKVSCLMAMPAAKGLFHRAVIQSGPMPRALEPTYAEEMANQLLAELKLSRGDVRGLQAMPVGRVMTAYYDVYARNGGTGTMGIVQGFLPVVDGGSLPAHPFLAKAPAQSAQVPLLIGCTRHEMAQYILAADPMAAQGDLAGLQRRLQPMLGVNTEEIIRAYRRTHPDADAWTLHRLITADWPTRRYTRHIAELQSAIGAAPVYLYRIDWETPVEGGVLGAPHAIEIPFVFDTLATETAFHGGGPAAQAMADLMSDTWIAFAKSGNPNHARLAQWPPFESRQRATMLFDRQSRIVSDPDGADLETLRRFFPEIK